MFASTFPNSSHCIVVTYMGKNTPRDKKVSTDKDILGKIFVFVSIYGVIPGVTSIAKGTHKHWEICYAST